MHTNSGVFSRIIVLVGLLIVAAPAAAQGGCGASGSNNASCTPPTPYISNVSIGSLNNNSPGCVVPPAYSDFTALPGPTLPWQVPTPIVVTVSSSFGGGFCRVYCAWNVNCPYDASYLLSGVGSGTTVFTGTITPPLGAMASAKMRVVFRPFFPPNSIGVGDMGETEDYTVATCPNASVAFLGAGCGPAGPQLSSTPPQIGSTLTLSVTGAPPSAAGLLFAGAPAPAQPIGGGCSVHLDLATIFELVPIATDPAGNWSMNLLVPNVPALAGSSAGLQGVVLLSTPPGFVLTSAILATIGC